MNIIYKIGVAFVFIIILHGCASMEIDDSSLNEIKSIGVASTLGHELNVVLIGTTMFNNKQYTVDVSDWNVDEESIEAATSILDKNGHYRVKSIGADFEPYDYQSMIAVARKEGLDTVIVVTPSRYDNQPHYRRGYGLHRRSFLGQASDCIYSLFIVEVIDVITEKKMAWNWGFSTWSGIPCYGKDTNLVWKKDFEEYTNHEKVALKEAVVESIQGNIPIAMKNLGLLSQE